MAVNASRPSRNAATATSLAAFSTTGSPLRAASARNASARQGTASMSGALEIQPPGARKIERRQRRRPPIGI